MSGKYGLHANRVKYKVMIIDRAVNNIEIAGHDLVKKFNYPGGRELVTNAKRKYAGAVY